MFNVWRLFQEKEKAEDLLKQTSRMTKQMMKIVANLKEIKLPEYTGWFILLAIDVNAPSGFKFVSFFNPDISSEETEPIWDLAIPIKKERYISEFTGW